MLNNVDYTKELSSLANSDEFRILERQLSENNARFKDLDYKTKLVSIYLFNSKQEHFIKDLWRLFYRRRPPTISEFLSKKYLGLMGDMIYPIWRNVLEEAFSTGSKRFELIFGGAIGTGKTTAARIAQAYNLLRIMCLKQPQLTLGVTPDTLLVLSLFTVTKEKAELAVMKPFISILEISPLFQEVRAEKHFKDFADKDPFPYYIHAGRVVLPRNVMIYPGSTLQHSLSFSIFGAILDEAEFRMGGVREAFDIYSGLKERIRSRFLGSRFIFLNMVSSAKYTKGIIAEHVNSIKPDDPYTKSVASAIWDVKDFDVYSKGYFYVLRGTQSHPSRVLDRVYNGVSEKDKIDNNEYKAPPNCELIKVPAIYETDFDRRIDEALRNLAGVQTFSIETLFDDCSNLFSDWLCPEFQIIASLDNEIPLLNKLPKEIFEQTISGKRLKRYPNATRYIHIDLAEISEAGFAMGHKELYGDIIHYVTDFVCFITSPNRINIESVQQLVIDLREVTEVHLSVVSTDQYQSAAMRQMLEKKKIATNVNHTSVDRNPTAYLQLSQLVHTKTFHTGKALKLQEQLEGVMLDTRFKHDKIVTDGRKDMADASAGWVHNAIMNALDTPIYQFMDTDDLKTREIDGWESV